MILTCPSCSTQYFADDASIGEAGRTVRCAACNTSWFAKPELSLEQQLDKADLSREAVERERQSSRSAEPHLAIRERELAKRKSTSQLAAGAAWSVTAVAFFGLGAVAVMERDTVVKYWPQASTAYAAAGLDVNRFGLEFTHIDADRSFDGTTPILTVSGKLINTTTRYQPAPTVKVKLRDEYGRDVDTLYIPVDTDVIAPGTTADFKSRLDSPPLEAFDLAVSFVDQDLASIAIPQAEISGSLPAGSLEAVDPDSPGHSVHPPDDPTTGDHEPAASDHGPSGHP